MAARSRILGEGREHDKKDDAFIPRRSNPRSFLSRLKPFRRRRVVLLLLAVWALYLFFKHIPTDLPPTSERYDLRYGRLHPGLPGPKAWGSQEQHTEGTGASSHTYDGPIKFYGLPKTLRGRVYIPDSKGNVLFAVSRLESIARILPVACSMAHHNRTHVHLAFMGRQYAEMEDIRKFNGIPENECGITVHDARPDLSAQSSEKRLRVSAGASLGHIHATMTLQAVLAGDTDYEDAWLLEGLRDKINALDLSLIPLPAGGLGAVSWISNLDAPALKQSNKVNVDIIIQAPPESSASLIRLLRSIKDADYTSWKLPRIIIELPAHVDPFLGEYLSKFRWPPDARGSDSRLIIRHRIDANFISPERAALQTVESFYPLSPSESYVLVLSPRVELSSGYFQFLMHTILEYRFASGHGELGQHLCGISLELPTYAPDMETKAPWESGPVSEPLVLWQAPSSNAGLYFGDRWVELHTFLSHRVQVDSAFTQRAKSTPRLSREYPAWLQNVLELMQTRNYYMMYPAFALKEGLSPVTVHRELHQLPEEYMNDVQDSDESLMQQKPSGILAEDQPLTAADEIERLMQKEKQVYIDSIVAPLLAAMSVGQPKEGSTEASDIPLISFDGQRVGWEESRTASWKFAEDFAASVGGCAHYDPTKKENDNVESLFCLDLSETG
ncbi:hypothetical protein A1O1_02969 [Capronia coronata CBS 617.96]|uniref:Glycosyltransferase 2 n=1 Tax=Capronia coronata CBS 617.96 TaxID=1182541 RepID=W9YPU3_9EURO|nr:uncharacterized protein A1O1_02969 [Capronia coronata CBS 617.96]EXJ94573.1 hypothetical protein A1O1_02969 [Capronia coronata CBS 617.96]